MIPMLACVAALLGQGASQRAPLRAYADFRRLSIELLNGGTTKEGPLLARLSATPIRRLRGWSAVVGKESLKDPVAALAPSFALAIRGVELSTNLSRMYRVYELFDRLDSRDQQFWNKAAAVEKLPRAYWRIFVGTDDTAAVQSLWKMRLDGGRAEIQDLFMYRCLKLRPARVLADVPLGEDMRVDGLVEELKADKDSRQLRSTLARLSRSGGPAATSAQRLLRKAGGSGVPTIGCLGARRSHGVVAGLEESLGTRTTLPPAGQSRCPEGLVPSPRRAANRLQTG